MHLYFKRAKASEVTYGDAAINSFYLTGIVNISRKCYSSRIKDKYLEKNNDKEKLFEIEAVFVNISINLYCFTVTNMWMQRFFNQ
jgi:hypothetical protein